ncbi:MAG: DUF3747 domain-containing protein [Arthrospira sp. PLM2.Bin9]|nr:DUF3747 domain-containing protein [Arthrospira sp. PLM2.Bin9]TVU54717.1 MAG: DUF3747 domain-containing protein [Arthrospira sp. PLM2.Bin9]
MKISLTQTIITLAAATFSMITGFSPANAVQFGQQEVDQDRFVAMAVPRAFGYSLVVVEQISDSRPCWSENGSRPVQVEPLLLNFDFTGICGRATDSNGYSVRMGGQDLALSHSLTVQAIPGEILLVANSRADVYAPPIIIGRSFGRSSGFTKIFLEPGWRFTKRTYNDRTLGHIYFTHDNLPR